MPSYAADFQGIYGEVHTEKRKQSLVNQWVKQSALPPEEVTPEMLGEKPTKETGLASDDIPREQMPYYAAMTDIDRGMVRLPIRYVIFGLSIIAFLLVALSILITILIMR